MKKTAIFYFTGTGNSLSLAKKLSNKLDNSEIISIPYFLKNADNFNLEYDKIGIVFPVYWAGLPHIVQRFAEKIKFTDNQYIFAVSNFGKMGGHALVQLDNLLKEKNQKLSASTGIFMPDNYQIMYDPEPVEKQNKFFNDADIKIEEISRIINNNEFIKTRELFPGKIISVLTYKAVMTGINKSDKNFTVSDKCSKCGICQKVCPVSNIEIINNKPVWNHKCEFCLACFQWCPQNAIQYKNKTTNRKRYTHPDISINMMVN